MANVTLSSPNVASVVVPVTLNVSAQPTLAPNPSSFANFTFTVTGTLPTSQMINIGSSTPGLVLVPTFTPGNTAVNWLSLNQSGGSTPANLTASVSAAGLALPAGTYTGTIALTSPNVATVNMPVTLVVSPQPTIVPSPTGVSFIYTIGQPTLPTVQTVTLASSPTGEAGYTASVSGAGCSSWLGVAVNTNSLIVSANPLSLAANAYSCSILVNGPVYSFGAAPVQLSIPVGLTVSPQPVIAVSPGLAVTSGMTFGYTAASTVQPTPQILNISAAPGLYTTGYSVTATVATTSGGNWLSAVPSPGSTPYTLTVTASPSLGLAPAVYSGTITLSGFAATNVVIPVTLTVTSTTTPAVAGVFRQGFLWDLQADARNPSGLVYTNFVSPVVGDIPVVGDWNGSGTTKIGIYRPSSGTWFLDYNGDGIFTAGVDKTYQFGGIAGDTPVVGDWSGSGFAKIGLVRPFVAGGQPALWILDYNGDGSIDTGDQVFGFGGVQGDIPVAGDWTGDGKAKVGVVRPFTPGGQAALWILDANNDHTIGAGDLIFAFGGITGDVPVVGDWSGTGTAKVGMVRPFTAGGTPALWIEDFNGSAPTVLGGNDNVVFAFGGIAGDKPVVGKW
jgi:hypothetical protein